LPENAAGKVGYAPESWMITQKWQANGFRCLSFADLEGVRDSLASFGEQVKGER
jgi:hypothetical protein